MKERFWLRGDQQSLERKLFSMIQEIKKSDKYSYFKQYRSFVEEILDIIYPIIKDEDDKSMDARRFTSEVLKIVQRHFGKTGMQFWEPYVSILFLN